MLRKNFSVLLFTCFLLGITAPIIGQPSLGFLGNVSVNSVIYSNDPSSYNLVADVVNLGNANVDAGDSLEVMVAVNGNFGNAVAWDGYYLNPNNVGPLMPYSKSTPMRIRFNSNNDPSAYNGWGPATNHFRSGGGQVHVITIWPTKVAGTPGIVTTLDTINQLVLYIDAAGFSVANAGVTGLSSTVQYNGIYNISVLASNIGVGANTGAIQFFAKLDNYPPVMLGDTNATLNVNAALTESFPNFNLSSIFNHLNLPPNFSTSAHTVEIYAQEHGYVNAITKATFNVDASTAFAVELAGFSGKLVDNRIQLDWATTSEDDNSHFLVEKLNPENDEYDQIARVRGAGLSVTTQNYKLVDYYPHAGKNIYRLSQVDFDGQLQYVGNVIEVNYTISELEAQVLALYPNPVVDVAYIRVKNPTPQQTFVEVYNLTGQRVYRQELDLPAGVANVRMDLSAQMPGTYVYKIVIDNLPMIGKIMKY